MLDKKIKQRIINKFRTHEKDTGSSQVQIAILSEEIKLLTEHLNRHKHDNSSRRGLLRKVAERRKLLKYLQKEDEKAFIELVGKLKLKIGKKMIEEEAEIKRREQEELEAAKQRAQDREDAEEAAAERRAES
ncbi:30S ribosomal protein S15 [Candidatus Falkowbacteria bacterium CG10_big_fil_rev_8_21_14_0_10_44_15]|uniref:Small ribosomal subunit protein uS15 n=1 Tax=Candidatus Falkowbacteria bacterium CG10_big_fil_rev_8_21_14_0_10_44_15 TaxID=1974569 RepID=A0A2H0UZT3_9BACT|nr:MAG: 30S ribosomal protein S15 [Candidatus Falkowbacteria bacterium CG10_big_fil_rev_8_21_14_0_10_44_15]